MRINKHQTDLKAEFIRTFRNADIRAGVFETSQYVWGWYWLVAHSEIALMETFIFTYRSSQTGARQEQHHNYTPRSVSVSNLNVSIKNHIF